MPKFADFVRETTTTTGTGAYSLAGPATNRISFVAGVGDGAEVDFAVENGSDFEIVRGTLTAGTPDTLSRDTVLASSNAGAAVNWGAGTKNIYLVASADFLSGLADFPKYAKISEHQDSGTDGGTPSAAGSYIARTINRKDYDPDNIVTLEPDDEGFTLQAGRYRARGKGQAFKSQRTRLRLYNTTDSEVVEWGRNAYTNDADITVVDAAVEADFTIAAAKTFKLQQYFQLAESGTGMGIALSDGGEEIYASIEIEQLA